MSQFNRATQAKRQPGSSIKPFVYLTALEHGFTPSTLVDDAPVSISQGRGMPPWTPANYSGDSFRGPTPLRVALEKSLNTVTARLAAALGMDAIGRTVEAFGIMDHMPRFYAMALGAGETTPLRHTAAYAMIANGGKRITPTLIDRIQDRYGKTIFRADQRECDACGETAWKNQPVPEVADDREQIADPGSTFQLVTMLEGVVQRGTGTVVKAIGKPVAGKTGTTNDWQDAWFVGFTPDLAAGVFVGYDEPAYLGSNETGGHLAAPIFRDFMMAALKDAPAKEFRMPPGLRMYRVSPTTGLPAGAGEPAIWEGYKPGTEPGWNPMPERRLPASRIGEATAGEPIRAAPPGAMAAAPVSASPAAAGAWPSARRATGCRSAGRRHRRAVLSGPARTCSWRRPGPAFPPRRPSSRMDSTFAGPRPGLTEDRFYARRDTGGRRRHHEVVGAAEEASLTGTSRTGVSPS